MWICGIRSGIHLLTRTMSLLFLFFSFIFLPDVSFASFTFGRSECGLAIGSGVFKVTLSEEGVKILVLCFVDFLSILLLFFAP